MKVREEDKVVSFLVTFETYFMFVVDIYRSLLMMTQNISQVLEHNSLHMHRLVLI